MLCENILVYDKNNNNITVSDDMGELANVRRDDKDGCNVSSHAGSGSAGAGINALVNKVNSFEYKKCSKSCLSALQSQISATKNSLKMYELAVDQKKIQNIAMAHKKLAQLENIKNNKDYQMIEKIAGQKALK